MAQTNGQRVSGTPVPPHQHLAAQQQPCPLQRISSNPITHHAPNLEQAWAKCTSEMPPPHQEGASLTRRPEIHQDHRTATMQHSATRASTRSSSATILADERDSQSQSVDANQRSAPESSQGGGDRIHTIVESDDTGSRVRAQHHERQRPKPCQPSVRKPFSSP